MPYAMLYGHHFTLKHIRYTQCPMQSYTGITQPYTTVYFSKMDTSILYYTILYYTMLYYAMLYYAMLYYSIA